MKNKKEVKNNKNYDHLKIEKKWQKFWEENKVYKTLDSKKAKSKKQKPCYVLDMFPYPSGAGLHVGHPRGYIGSDVYARMKRMQGYNVLHPMGYDAFGLPAEQYAIEHKIHPQKAVEINVKTFEKQLSIIGLSYDWSRKVNTTDPEFYKWTQWIFLQLFNSYYDTKKNKACPIEDLIKTFEKSGDTGVCAYTNQKSIFSAKEWKSLGVIEKQNVLMQYRLAYEAESEVNWCPKLGTVLANDEIVDKDGKQVSERGGYLVEKMLINQWSMRITAYADRLLSGLDKLDWASSIKEIQKNWIGKSQGALIKFDDIEVFTTRADTIYGATFIAIHGDKNKFTGRYVTNPATKEKIPVWEAEYVMADYGTGAIMGVPAHDERDFEFAKKNNLPIKEVIEPLFKKLDDKDGVKSNLEFEKRHAAVAIIKHWSEDKYLCLKWKKTDWRGFVIGGIEENENPIDSALREIVEETGYTSAKFVKEIPGIIHAQFYHAVKNINRWAHFHPVVFKLQNGDQKEIAEEERDIHDVVWVFKNEVDKYLSWVEDMRLIWNRAFNDYAYTGDGILTNSGEFDGLDKDTARAKIIKKVNGKVVTKYKMRDAIFARQRYWGEPIPLYRDKNGLIHEVKKLPLVLPKVNSYEPTGRAESPLAGVKSWVSSGYETNTMPGWAGSSWYFLRYMDPQNKKSLAGEKEIEYWKNVDMYIGGAEHATGHLLYSRFWNKFLYDIGIATVDEPFKRMRNQGMIGGPDGRKMSKRWGNVINPDDIVKTYGADTLRVYEMFLGPFDSHLPWNTESIMGSRRFIERVWRAGMHVMTEKKQTNIDIVYALQDLIKKIESDINEFKFNTAISGMMIFIGLIEDKNYEINNEDFLTFIKLLAPFAPHITEEIFKEFEPKTTSIHLNSWPKLKKLKTRITMQKIIVQFNGRLRGEILAHLGSDEVTIVGMIHMDDKYHKYFAMGELVRTIYVPNKIINFVIKNEKE